jgi:hypothetical protein
MSLSFAESQTLKSQGRIVNTGKGKITVKGALQSKDNGAVIENEGKIIIEGNAEINQDTLGGYVEYNWNENVAYQYVPSLHYKNVHFYGTTKKLLDTTYKRNFVAIDTFFVNNDVEIRTDSSHYIYTQGRVTHNGYINKTSLKGKLIYKGDEVQNVDGKGEYKELVLDNPTSAKVINEGGFKVVTSLELKQGEFQNTDSTNFIMGNKSNLIRHVGASIAYEPQLEGQLSVTYKGQGSLITGAEIPKGTSDLANLEISNSDTLFLDRNVDVNDSLWVNANVVTNDDTLSLRNRVNPFYGASPDLEIAGNFRRTVIEVGDTILLNNKYTFALFESLEDKGDVAELTFHILPLTQPDNGKNKVNRRINISGRDLAGNDIADKFKMQFRYAWRHAPGEDYDETNNLKVSELVLQRWKDNNWINFQSDEPFILSDESWAYGFSSVVNSTGVFAIGGPDFELLVFRAKVMLEGAYRTGKFATMAMDLNKRNEIPLTPPSNSYPYDLDPKLPTLSAIPDSVVDWVVLEFRKEKVNAAERFFKTAFIRYDGSIVGIDGKNDIVFDYADGIDSGGGDYYVFIRHRNHLMLRTKNPLPIYPDSNSVLYDFTSNSDLIEGGVQSLKLLDIDKDGNRLFGLRGGYKFDQVEDDFRFTLDPDRLAAYKEFTLIGYLWGDYNMDGIVNTKDFNISWNNRLK